jgi:hemerythrin-like domain-containing protein
MQEGSVLRKERQTMSESVSFSVLTKDHAELNRLFDGHQRALFAKDLDVAIRSIEMFKTELDRHIDFEEQRLLPVYTDKGGETAGGTLELFQAEHRKLGEGIRNLETKSEALRTSTDLVGSILALLDEEALFKGLLHHHALREQNLLFPRLDERTTDQERMLWLGTRATHR